MPQVFFVIDDFIFIAFDNYLTCVVNLVSINVLIHISPISDPLNHLWYLDHLIHQKVSPKVQRLLKSTSEGNRGVVIKPWIWDHHAFYNLKDYYSYRHHQDPDLVVDYQNSDLVF